MLPCVSRNFNAGLDDVSRPAGFAGVEINGPASVIGKNTKGTIFLVPIEIKRWCELSHRILCLDNRETISSLEMCNRNTRGQKSRRAISFEKKRKKEKPFELNEA